jgi:flagellar hook-associated protein 2
MGTIISGGVGSGLDITGLVQKLVEAEGAPKALRLDRAEAKAQAKLSALATLRSALSTFRDTLANLKNLDSFRGRQATMSVEDFARATVTTAAVPSSYAIEVEQLASAHKLRSEPYAAATTIVGTGTLSVAAGGQLFDIVIDDSNNTLEGIAAAINGSGAGGEVIANVIKGATNSYLTLSARDTGAANAITIAQSGGDGGLAALVYPPDGVGLTEVQAAADGLALIDGIAVSSATNTISGAIAGVEITLLAANEYGETSELTIGYDRQAARKSIDDLVRSYNAVVDAIKSVASYNAETEQGGPLFGDAGVRNLGYQLRRELTSTVDGLAGPFDMLNDIGVSMQLDGKLSVDGTRLDAAFDANFNAIGTLFADEVDGVAVKLDEALAPYLQFGGTFDSRKEALDSSIDAIGRQREALDLRLAVLQERYLRQFNALDGLLAQLQSTSNFLSQQLRQLPGNNLFKDS